MASGPPRSPARYLAPAAFLVAVVFLLVALSASGVLGGFSAREATSSTTTETRVIPLGEGEGGTTTTQAGSAATTGTQPLTAPPTPTTAPAATTTTAGAVTHVVQPGEHPVAIAERYGVSVTELMEYNDISDPRTLRVGTVLKIPPAD